jgi:hypothetical protein
LINRPENHACSVAHIDRSQQSKRAAQALLNQSRHNGRRTLRRPVNRRWWSHHSNTVRCGNQASPDADSHGVGNARRFSCCQAGEVFARLRPA